MYAARLLIAAALSATALASAVTAPPEKRQSPSPTATVLVGTLSSGFVGSVVGAQCSETTIALACTVEEACSGLTVTATQGPTDYRLVYSTSTDGAQGQISESCKLEGPQNSATSAVCHILYSLSAEGRSTSTSFVTSIPGSSLNYEAVTLTANAGALASATACESGSGAAPTAFAQVYKVVVPIGAAVVGALL